MKYLAMCSMEENQTGLESHKELVAESNFHCRVNGSLKGIKLK